jgi:hypothetical protein
MMIRNLKQTCFATDVPRFSFPEGHLRDNYIYIYSYRSISKYGWSEVPILCVCASFSNVFNENLYTCIKNERKCKLTSFSLNFPEN